MSFWANENPPLICHRKWTEKKIGMKLNKALDILELFAFVKPAEFCVPNPSGLAIATGLARPKTNIDKTIFLRTITQYLLDNLSEFVIENPEKNSLYSSNNLGNIAEMMGKGDGFGLRLFYLS